MIHLFIYVYSGMHFENYIFLKFTRKMIHLDIPNYFFRVISVKGQ